MMQTQKQKQLNTIEYNEATWNMIIVSSYHSQLVCMLPTQMPKNLEVALQRKTRTPCSSSSPRQHTQ
jgi:hypothetical protein